MASQGIQIPGSMEVADIPHGFAVFRKVPYAFMLPELIFGAWVWILVASTRVFFPLLQGWVMYVSVSSFLFTLILLMVYVFGFHRNHCGTWRLIDVIYHGLTAMFYLSAAVLQTYATIYCDSLIQSVGCSVVYYHLDASATFFAYLATLFYMLHSFQSYVH